jgi:EmrB/QacA subfamily drug resistance transporter
MDTAPRSRQLALLVLCTGFLLIVVDMTIVNVALPSIGRDLGFSQSGLAWVVNGYLVAYGGSLLLAGRLGDMVGRRRLFIAGMGGFMAASLLCGLSFDQPMLIAFRIVQGVAGAAGSAVILGMIVTLFPEPAEQARAIGVFSFVASAGAAIGLLAGGLITQAVSWHWIFFVNIPIGAATVVAALRCIDADAPAIVAERADVLGALLVTAGLMLAVYTIVETDRYGLASQHTALFGGVSLLLLLAFAVRQLRVSHPILPLRLFHSPAVRGANLVQALMASSFFAFFFLGSLDLERVLGYGPLQIGLAFLPVALAMGVLSVRLSAPLVMRFGAQRVLLAGQAVIAVALLLVATGPARADYLGNLFAPMLLLGLGGGLCFPSLSMLAMSGVDPRDAGLASGLLNTTGQVGGALGLAVLATLSSSRTASLAAHGDSAGAALSGGFHAAWAVAAACVVVCIALTATLLRSSQTAAAASPGEADDALAA